MASSVQCQTLWTGGRRQSGVLAWSVDGHGGSLALFRDEAVGGAETLSAVAGTLLDAALRALGLPTRPCLSPTVWFPDGVFLHRVAQLLQRRGGACTRRRLGWESLSVLYPLNDTGEPLSWSLTRWLRQRFHTQNTWSSLRRGVVGLPAAAPAILPGPDPAGCWLARRRRLRPLGAEPRVGRSQHSRMAVRPPERTLGGPSVHRARRCPQVLPAGAMTPGRERARDARRREWAVGGARDPPWGAPLC